MLRSLAAALVIAVSAPAGAWSIGSQLDYTGCHERITTAAFRAARARFPTAPVIVPTADEQALIGEVQFVPPADDLGGSVRLVVDPLAITVPVPHLGLIPLYYEQFRSMIGIQIGG